MPEVVFRPVIMSVEDFFANNSNKKAFGSTRFETTHDAELFIQGMKNRGADDFTLSDVRHEMWRYKQDGGPYSDMITFHVSPNKRRKVLNYVQNVGQPETLLALGADKFLAWWPPEQSKTASILREAQRYPWSKCMADGKKMGLSEAESKKRCQWIACCLSKRQNKLKKTGFCDEFDCEKNKPKKIWSSKKIAYNIIKIARKMLGREFFK